MVIAARSAVGSVGASPRPGSRHWGWDVFLVGAGSMLVAVGVGIGMPWAVRVGWSAASVVAIASLVVGLAAVVSGIHGLAVRRARPMARTGVVAMAALVVLAAVYVLAVPLMAAVPAPTGLGATPSSRGLAYQSVRIPADDGVVVAGWWVPSRNGAAVIVRHGSGSTRSSVLDQAAVLARHGYGVLLTDARGQGESAGRGMAWGWYGERDLAAAVTFLANTRGVDADRIAAVGMSMGGEEALAAEGMDPRLRAVVAEGVTGRSAADLGWLRTAYGWRGSVTLAVQWAQTWLADLVSPASRPTSLGDAVEALEGRRALLIAAGTSADEQHAAAGIASRASSVEVWVVPGAGHTGGLATAPRAWEEQVTAFLADALR